MAHPNLLDITKTALAVIDVQEAFRTAIPDLAGVVSNISTVVKGFQTLGVPVIVTEQYPKGLGRTADEIVRVLDAGNMPIEKTSFSSFGSPDFVERLSELGVKQVVICGLETHICVNQTAHDLLDLGFQVHVLADCVGSRTEQNRRTGLEKMTRSGAILSSVEMALFELMRDAKHPKFKEIQALVK